MPDILVEIHKAGEDSDVGVIRDVSVSLFCLSTNNSSFIIIKKKKSYTSVSLSHVNNIVVMCYFC